MIKTTTRRNLSSSGAQLANHPLTPTQSTTQWVIWSRTHTCCHLVSITRWNSFVSLWTFFLCSFVQLPQLIWKVIKGWTACWEFLLSLQRVDKWHERCLLNEYLFNIYPILKYLSSVLSTLSVYWTHSCVHGISTIKSDERDQYTPMIVLNRERITSTPHLLREGLSSSNTDDTIQPTKC